MSAFCKEVVLENVKVGMCERMKVQNSESLTVQIWQICQRVPGWRCQQFGGKNCESKKQEWSLVKFRKKEAFTPKIKKHYKWDLELFLIGLDFCTSPKVHCKIFLLCN